MHKNRNIEKIKSSSKGLTSDERISIMEKEHDISSQDLGKVMETMCNPGEGIRKMLWRTDLSKKLQKAAQKLIFYDTEYVSRRNSHRKNRRSIWQNRRGNSGNFERKISKF